MAIVAFTFEGRASFAPLLAGVVDGFPAGGIRAPERRALTSGDGVPDGTRSPEVRESIDLVTRPTWPTLLILGRVPAA
jgi:hypothetical protein